MGLPAPLPKPLGDFYTLQSNRRQILCQPSISISQMLCLTLAPELGAHLPFRGSQSSGDNKGDVVKVFYYDKIYTRLKTTVLRDSKSTLVYLVYNGCLARLRVTTCLHCLYGCSTNELASH